MCMQNCILPNCSILALAWGQHDGVVIKAHMLCLSRLASLLLVDARQQASDSRQDRCITGFRVHSEQVPVNGTSWDSHPYHNWPTHLHISFPIPQLPHSLPDIPRSFTSPLILLLQHTLSTHQTRSATAVDTHQRQTGLNFVM